jgi:hypothetical protein
VCKSISKDDSEKEIVRLRGLLLSQESHFRHTVSDKEIERLRELLLTQESRFKHIERKLLIKNAEYISKFKLLESENNKLREEIEYLKLDLTLDLKNNVSAIAEPIPECECSCLKTQVQSLKLQLTAEKRISQKYMHDLQQRDKHQAILTAM